MEMESQCSSDSTSIPGHCQGSEEIRANTSSGGMLSALPMSNVVPPDSMATFYSSTCQQQPPEYLNPRTPGGQSYPGQFVYCPTVAAPQMTNYPPAASYNYFQPVINPGSEYHMLMPTSANTNSPQIYMSPAAPPMMHQQQVPSSNHHPHYTGQAPLVFGYIATVPCVCSSLECTGYQQTFIAQPSPVTEANSSSASLRPSVLRHQNYHNPVSTGNLFQNTLSTPQPTHRQSFHGSGEGGSLSSTGLKEGQMLKRQLFVGKTSPPMSPLLSTSSNSPLQAPLDDSDTSAWSARKRVGYYNNILYKTLTCKDHTKTGRCPRGSACQFAHGLTEVHDPRKHPLYKTAFCHDFKETGKCPRGDYCFHVHHEREMRKKPPNRRPVVLSSPVLKSDKVNANFIRSEVTSPTSSGDRNKLLQESMPASFILSSTKGKADGESISPSCSISDETVVKFIKKKGMWSELMQVKSFSTDDIYEPVKFEESF